MIVNSAVTSANLIIIWISASAYVSNNLKAIGKRFKLESQALTGLMPATTLCIGACLTYSFIAALNITTHFFGETITFQAWVPILTLLILILSRNEILKFYAEFKKYFRISQLKKFWSNRNKKNSILEKILILCLLISIIGISYRLCLPVTWEDMLDQYFYDSLQISRLGNIDLDQYYRLGQGFRTGSAASFFDAYILQLTDSWFIPRAARLVSLILVIAINIEILSTFKDISPIRYLLQLVVILSLVDIWTISVSGKHDIYICLLELTTFRVAMLSQLDKSINFKIRILTYPLFIGIVSMFSRLSSMALLIVLLIYIAHQILSSSFVNGINWKLVLIPFLLISASIIIFGYICLLNYIYKDNPFYIVQPPSFLRDLFPNAQYVYDLKFWRYKYNLHNIPRIFYPFAVFLYSSLGLEQIRYFAFRLSDIPFIAENTYQLLSKVGPARLVHSITGFSPFVLFAFSRSQKEKLASKSINKNLLFIISWLFIWSIGITYTRAALASSILLTTYGIAEFKLHRSDKYRLLGAFSIIKKSFIIYAIISAILFTLWGFTNLRYLPNIFKYSNIPYDRSKLVEEYIVGLNKNQNTNYLLPSNDFQASWDNYKPTSANEKTMILVGAPTEFSYFMSHGLTMLNISTDQLSNAELSEIHLYKVNSENKLIEYNKSEDL